MCGKLHCQRPSIQFPFQTRLCFRRAPQPVVFAMQRSGVSLSSSTRTVSAWHIVNILAANRFLPPTDVESAAPYPILDGGVVRRARACVLPIQPQHSRFVGCTILDGRVVRGPRACVLPAKPQHSRFVVYPAGRRCALEATPTPLTEIAIHNT